MVLESLFADLPAVAAHHGWRRVCVDERLWRAIGEALRDGKLELLACVARFCRTLGIL